VRIVSANFGRPFPRTRDYRAYWERHELPPPREQRLSLFDHAVDWGFHIYAFGILLMDRGIAERAEFWDFAPEPSTVYHSNGTLRVMFENEEDVAAYIERHGVPNLFINHGRGGLGVLPLLEGKCFRVHLPVLRGGLERTDNHGAECYLVDAEDQLDDRSMVYVPVVNTRKIFPIECAKQRDFIYLASLYAEKRHDLLLAAVRGTELTGHLHPVDGSQLDLSGTRVTTSKFNERDVVELLRTSRIAVYPGHRTSNPAAMWECVAAGLPIVVNANILGGKHLVVPGVTGELAPPERFADTMRDVLRNRDRYSPRAHFERHWDTVATLDRYFEFFAAMGWRPPAGARCSGA